MVDGKTATGYKLQDNTNIKILFSLPQIISCEVLLAVAPTVMMHCIQQSTEIVSLQIELLNL